jgi:hypothetical protein
MFGNGFTLTLDVEESIVPVRLHVSTARKKVVVVMSGEIVYIIFVAPLIGVQLELSVDDCHW